MGKRAVGETVRHGFPETCRTEKGIYRRGNATASRRSSLVYSGQQVLEDDMYEESASRRGVRWQATLDTALASRVVPEFI
jgi:hypothetical protein